MNDIEPRIENMIVIVVGAHLRAELNDRAAAHALHDVMCAHPLINEANVQIAVCTDVWYLNNEPLRARPTISIGSPDVNALAAFLADRLPAAFTVDDVMTVQMDLEFVDPVASCWGVSHAETAAATELFTTRYLTDFIKRAVQSPAGS